MCGQLERVAGWRVSRAVTIPQKSEAKATAGDPLASLFPCLPWDGDGGDGLICQLCLERYVALQRRAEEGCRGDNVPIHEVEQCWAGVELLRAHRYEMSSELGERLRLGSYF